MHDMLVSKLPLEILSMIVFMLYLSCQRPNLLRRQVMHGVLGSVLVMPVTYAGDVQTELQEEVKDMAKKMGAAGMQLLVIDTENKFVSTGFAEEIAKAGLGKYYYLPNASEASIAAAASGAMAQAKAGY